MRGKNLSNWAKTLILLGMCVLAMAIPITRHLLLWILPLGSGIDDLIFFVLLFAFIIVALIRLADVDTLIANMKNWFSK